MKKIIRFIVRRNFMGEGTNSKAILCGMISAFLLGIILYRDLWIIVGCQFLIAVFFFTKYAYEKRKIQLFLFFYNLLFFFLEVGSFIL